MSDLYSVISLKHSTKSCMKAYYLNWRKHGFKVDVLRWIENYLHDRCQKVTMDGFSSGIVSTNADVPQGSVLGPFLFLIYINYR